MVSKLTRLWPLLIASVVVALGVWFISTQSQSAANPRAAVASALPASAASLKTVTITAGGMKRTYLLYVPRGDSKRHRLPLVLVYHGANETAWNAVSDNNLLNVAEQYRDMILVYMQGYDDTWNDDAGDPPAEQANVPDITFTTAVLHRVESSYYVNRQRVVATGISNGAIFAELLGCRVAADLTLIVPVEGQIASTFSGNCRPSTPIAVYEVHATSDPVIPYWGGTFSGVGGPVSVLSAPASAARWASLDRCSPQGSASRSGDSVLTRYSGCRDQVSVTLNSIQGGGHYWPANFGETLVAVMSSLSGKRQARVPA